MLHPCAVMSLKATSQIPAPTVPRNSTSHTYYCLPSCPGTMVSLSVTSIGLTSNRMLVIISITRKEVRKAVGLHGMGVKGRK